AVRGLAIGYEGPLTYRVLGSGALGGMTTGFSTRLDGDASAGPRVRFGEVVSLFARAGMRIDSYNDNELDVGLYALPSASAGVSIATRPVIFELAPHAGATLRAAYALGNEDLGERYHRPRDVAASWGGSTVIVTPLGYVEGAVDRVEQTKGLW